MQTVERTEEASAPARPDGTAAAGAVERESERERGALLAAAAL